MHTALRLLLLTLTALLLQAWPALAQAKEAPVKGSVVQRLLKTEVSAAKPCQARHALLTTWQEADLASASSMVLGMASDEERAEMQAPTWDMASPIPPDQMPAPWVSAWRPDPWLPVRLRPPIVSMA